MISRSGLTVTELRRKTMNKSSLEKIYWGDLLAMLFGYLDKRYYVPLKLPEYLINYRKVKS